jgi:hypothetical protein
VDSLTFHDSPEDWQTLFQSLMELREYLNYPVGDREPQRAVWLPCNRHLNSFAESDIMNVGGYPETDVPSSREEKHG